jgi:hypothetical protein
MELLVSILIIGIVLGTMYFSLDNLRKIFHQEKKLDISRKNLDTLYYLFSLWTGKSRLTECGERRLSFLRELRKSSKEDTEQGRGQIRREMRVVLERITIRDNVHYVLTRLLRPQQGGVNVSKRIRYLFSHKALAENDIARLRAHYGASFAAGSKLEQQRDNYTLEWRCPKAGEGVPVLFLRAFRLRGSRGRYSKQEKSLVRGRSFLFSWQLSPETKTR